MKKRFTPSQIAFALRQAASGTPTSEITRKMGVTDVTFYRWKKLYSNLGTAEIRRLKELEEENHRLSAGSFVETNTMLLLHQYSSGLIIRSEVERKLAF